MHFLSLLVGAVGAVSAQTCPSYYTRLIQVSQATAEVHFVLADTNTPADTASVAWTALTSPLELQRFTGLSQATYMPMQASNVEPGHWIYTVPMLVDASDKLAYQISFSWNNLLCSSLLQWFPTAPSSQPIMTTREPTDIRPCDDSLQFQHRIRQSMNSPDVFKISFIPSTGIVHLLNVTLLVDISEDSRSAPLSSGAYPLQASMFGDAEERSVLLQLHDHDYVVYSFGLRMVNGDRCQTDRFSFNVPADRMTNMPTITAPTPVEVEMRTPGAPSRIAAVRSRFEEVCADSRNRIECLHAFDGLFCRTYPDRCSDTATRINTGAPHSGRTTTVPAERVHTQTRAPRERGSMMDCGDVLDANACRAADVCFYDVRDGRCENKQGCAGGSELDKMCCRLSEPQACMSNTRCFFDNADQRCEAKPLRN